MQISRISFQDPQFPDRLHDLERLKGMGVPKQIFVRGTLPKPEDRLITIVGTRKVSKYGEQVTYQLAYELAQAGAVIVSGLAFGVDTIAIRAAVEAGGRAIAVLGTPLDRISPAPNRGLANELLELGGALISEYEVGTEVQPWFFAVRDRIIAALSEATIVTESPTQGGSLITASHAKELGRNVMAVPGNITSENSAGTNRLIAQGAKLVTNYTDVAPELGLHIRVARPVMPRSKEEATIANLLETASATSQQLIEASGFSAAQFANVISLMEITGKVRNLGAGVWVRR